MAVVLITAACGSAAEGSATTGSWAGAALVQALPKPKFVLTDTQGRPYDFRAQTAGKVTLLYFGYTHCPDVCPLNMATLASALRQLPPQVEDKIVVVFVTTDPARDTPKQLRSWLNQFNPQFVGLTGSPNQVAMAQREAGVQVATKESDGASGYGINHAAEILAYTPDNLAHITFLAGLPASAEAADLRRLVTHGWSRSG